MIEFYGYPRCSTCRKAEKALKEMGHSLKTSDITLTPPSRETLQSVLKSGRYQVKDLLNTSGEVYRALGLKDKIKTMPEAQILKLLSENGKLVKRPLAIDGNRVTVGYKEGDFRKVWG